METGYNREADIKRLKFIVDELHVKVGTTAHILDVGCGNGIISIALGKLGYQVQGIDISESAIANAKKNNTLPNVSFDVISAEELQASGKKYDAVICSEVLEHLHQPQDLLQVLHQSLKDDGIVIVTVPNGVGPRESLITKPVQKLQKQNGFAWRLLSKVKLMLGYSGQTVQSSAADLTHVQFFTRNSLSNLANKASFNIVSFGKTNFADDIFPFSMIAKRSRWLQRIDGKLADILPYRFTGGFVSVWRKKQPA